MSVSLSVLCRINGIYFDDFLLLKASSWEMIRIALCLWQSALWLFNCIWTIKDQTYKSFQRERNCPVLAVAWKCSTGSMFRIDQLSSFELSSSTLQSRKKRLLLTASHMSLLTINTNSLPCSVGTRSGVTARSVCRSTGLLSMANDDLFYTKKKKEKKRAIESETSRRRKVIFFLVIFIFLLFDSI